MRHAFLLVLFLSLFLIFSFWATYKILRPALDPPSKKFLDQIRKQYYTRLAVANKAFRVGIPGWMTDRGRIYILLDDLLSPQRPQHD